MVPLILHTIITNIELITVKAVSKAVVSNFIQVIKIVIINKQAIINNFTCSLQVTNNITIDLVISNTAVIINLINNIIVSFIMMKHLSYSIS